MIAIAFGGNHFNSKQLISTAMMDVAQHLCCVRESTIHQTSPLGQGTRNYFNSVITAESTGMDVSDLWQLCQEIEKQHGRNKVNEIPWGNRSIDVDVLFYHSVVHVDENLILPHPQMHRRSFVLEPLVELIPDWVHPILNKRCKDLFFELSF